MKILALSATAAIAILASAVSFNSLADSDDDAVTAAAQQNAKITLAEAVTIAEQATGGKSSEAEFEIENGISVYEIEVAMADGSEIELKIGAQSGSILSQEVEDEDDDDDHHEKDNRDKDDKA